MIIEITTAYIEFTKKVADLATQPYTVPKIESKKWG